MASESQNEGPSLLEQMMADAEASRAKDQKDKAVKEKAAVSTFGTGFKKGFFQASNTDKRIPVDKTKTSISTVRPKVQTSENGPSSDLVIPEVQQAMRESTPSAVKTIQSGGTRRSHKSADDYVSLRSYAAEWVTPELMSRLAGHPKLSKALHDPRFAQVLTEVTGNPQAAMNKYKDVPEVREFIVELMTVLGEHFTELGKQQRPTGIDTGSSRVEGPLVDQALRRHPHPQTTHQPPAPPVRRVRTTSSSSPRAAMSAAAPPASCPLSPAGSNDEDEDQAQVQVNKILADPELLSLLMDPAMQQIIMECGEPARLNMHMRDPVVAGKITRLRDAGLVQMIF